ncbi:hypothetical protein D5R81_03530 [Parashewanella spongiae]|uniref:Uncharacterized protein n=3 Tax=Parashewanella spongiae TaxID=342950 RepID=A0A3A6U428_9GAMM|nr:hypothetical protein D5R81_03530 [Parashewanella spongiae]
MLSGYPQINRQMYSPHIGEQNGTETFASNAIHKLADCFNSENKALAREKFKLLFESTELLLSQRLCKDIFGLMRPDYQRQGQDIYFKFQPEGTHYLSRTYMHSLSIKIPLYLTDDGTEESITIPVLKKERVADDYLFNNILDPNMKPTCVIRTTFIQSNINEITPDAYSVFTSLLCKLEQDFDERELCTLAHQLNCCLKPNSKLNFITRTVTGIFYHQKQSVSGLIVNLPNSQQVVYASCPSEGSDSFLTLADVGNITAHLMSTDYSCFGVTPNDFFSTLDPFIGKSAKADLQHFVATAAKLCKYGIHNILKVESSIKEVDGDKFHHHSLILYAKNNKVKVFVSSLGERITKGDFMAPISDVERESCLSSLTLNMHPEAHFSSQSQAHISPQWQQRPPYCAHQTHTTHLTPKKRSMIPPQRTAPCHTQVISAQYFWSHPESHLTAKAEKFELNASPQASVNHAEYFSRLESEWESLFELLTTKALISTEEDLTAAHNNLLGECKAGCKQYFELIRNDEENTLESRVYSKDGLASEVLASVKLSKPISRRETTNSEINYRWAHQVAGLSRQ